MAVQPVSSSHVQHVQHVQGSSTKASTERTPRHRACHNLPPSLVMMMMLMMRRCCYCCRCPLPLRRPPRERRKNFFAASQCSSRPLGRHSEGSAQRRSANSGHLLSARPPTDKALLGRPAASLNHTESSWLRWAGQKSVVRPPFQVQHFRPSVRAHLCFHYPRAYLTTTARPPTGPNPFFLSDIINPPYTPYPFPVPALRLPTASASKRPEPLVTLTDLPLSPFPHLLAPNGPSIRTEGCAGRRWEIVS